MSMRKRLNVLKRFWEWISHGYTLWGILNLIFPTIGGILGGFLTWLASLPPYIIFFGVLGGIALGLWISNELAARRILKRISLDIGSNPVSEESIKTQPSAHFSNQKLYITELARDSILLKDKVFVNCELIGLAVIYFKNSVITNCVFDAKLEDMLIVIDPPRIITGIVGFENCVFKECRFFKIGIITNKGGEEKFKKSLSS